MDDNMYKLMEDRQITDYYQAQRHIQSAMMGDTPVKTVQNRQYIDNMSDYDSELQRISKSVHHKLDLGPISLLEAQQHTTVETAAALKYKIKQRMISKHICKMITANIELKYIKGQKT